MQEISKRSGKRQTEDIFREMTKGLLSSAFSSFHVSVSSQVATVSPISFSLRASDRQIGHGVTGAAIEGRAKFSRHHP
jgi:hypothetical protein